MAWEGKKSRSPLGIIAAIGINAALVVVLLTALVVRNNQSDQGPVTVRVEKPDETKTEDKTEKPIPIPKDDKTPKPEDPKEPIVVVGEPSPPLPDGSNKTYPHPAPNSGEPEYPPTERRLGHEGKVVLALCIDADGKVTSASVKVSSGYPQLDRAALDWAKSIRWRPGTVEGRPTAMCFEQPYRFVIEDR